MSSHPDVTGHVCTALLKICKVEQAAHACADDDDAAPSGPGAAAQPQRMDVDGAQPAGELLAASSAWQHHIGHSCCSHAVCVQAELAAEHSLISIHLSH